MNCKQNCKCSVPLILLLTSFSYLEPVNFSQGIRLARSDVLTRDKTEGQKEKGVLKNPSRILWEALPIQLQTKTTAAKIIVTTRTKMKQTLPPVFRSTEISSLKCLHLSPASSTQTILLWVEIKKKKTTQFKSKSSLLFMVDSIMYHMERNGCG